MEPKVTLRTATLADVALLRRWDNQPHVQAATGGNDDDWDWEKELARSVPWREQLIAEVASTPIGMVQIIDPAEEETQYWGEIAPNLRALDIWIGEPDYLGRGFGTQMMREVIKRCFAHREVTAILIDPLESNVRAIRFYERIGFVKVERRTFETDDCWVMRLDREAKETSN